MYKINDEQGFSILEVVIASGILVILAISFTNLLTDSFTHLRRTEEIADTRSGAQQDLERVLETFDSEGINALGNFDNAAELRYTFPATGGVNELDMEVRGVMFSNNITNNEAIGDLQLFIPHVPAVAAANLNPDNNHTYGNQPPQLTLDIFTQEVIDGTNLTTSLVNSDTNNVVRQEVNAIVNNQTQAVLDLEDGIRPTPGQYNIDFEIDGLAATNRDRESGLRLNYTIQPIRTIVVGDQGTLNPHSSILTSFDSEEWGYRENITNITNPINDITYGGSEDNKRFVAVGDGGLIISSEDGVHWDRRTSGVTENLQAVTCGGQGNHSRFVAVGNNGTIISSDFDNMSGNWDNESSSINSNDFLDITYGGPKGQERFIIVGNLDSIADTTVLSCAQDSNNWQKKKLVLPSGNWSEVAWLNLEDETAVEKEKQQIFILAKQGKIYPVKIDENGELVFDNSYQRISSGYDAVQFNDIAVGEQSCTVVGEENGEPRMFVYRVNASGEWKWIKSSIIDDGWAVNGQEIGPLLSVENNNQKLVMTAQTKTDQGIIIYGQEAADGSGIEWIEAEINTSFSPNGVRLNEMIVIN